MVNSMGDPVIADFGVSRIVEDITGVPFSQSNGVSDSYRCAELTNIQPINTKVDQMVRTRALHGPRAAIYQLRRLRICYDNA